MAHFSKAHVQLLEEDNTNLTHLITNIRRITATEESVRFSLRNELISQLSTYGVITKGADGLCEILMFSYSIITHRPWNCLISQTQ